MNTTNKPKVVSLFAGCGGSSLGYSMAGYDVRLAVEWDKGATDVYQRNFPTTQVFQGDIANLSVAEALELAGVVPGELDILDGSPPCQGFSTAGKRKFNDSRNQLFLEYVRLLEGFAPKVFVMENVSGLIKGKMKLAFAEMTRALKAVGYTVSCRLLNAWWYGVPQDRKRVIWIGTKEGIPSHPIPSVDKAVSVIEALGETEGMYKAWRPRLIGLYNAQFSNKPRSPGLPSSTLGAMRPPTIIRGNMTRYINIQEAKILQGFPEWFDIREGEYKYIGNSVCPPMAEAVGRHLLRLLVTG